MAKQHCSVLYIAAMYHLKFVNLPLQVVEYIASVHGAHVAVPMITTSTCITRASIIQSALHSAIEIAHKALDCTRQNEAPERAALSFKPCHAYGYKHASNAYSIWPYTPAL